MKTIKNPFILKSKSLGFKYEKRPTDRGTIKPEPPVMEVLITQIEIEDLECSIERSSFIDREEIKVIFEDSHIWLEYNGNDFETHFFGEYSVTVNNVEVKKDSVVLDIELVCDIGC